MPPGYETPVATSNGLHLSIVQLKTNNEQLRRELIIKREKLSDSAKEYVYFFEDLFDDTFTNEKHSFHSFRFQGARV